jgi:hypothetical protein
VIDRLTHRYPKIVFHAVQGEVPMLERALRGRAVDLVVGRTLGQRSTTTLMRKFYSKKRWSSLRAGKADGLGDRKSNSRS